MSNQMIPIHLEGYDVFGHLAEWAEKSPELKRHAQVSTRRMGTGRVFCEARLTWVAKNGSLCNITHVEASAQEATWNALLKFDRANCSGDHGEQSPEKPAMKGNITITPGPGWDLVNPKDGTPKDEDILLDRYYSEAFKHEVDVTGIRGGYVYYRHRDGDRAGEEGWKHIDHFRATYKRKAVSRGQ